MNLGDVTAILHEHVDPGLEAVELTRGTVGNSQETWFVDARAASGDLVQLVLRRTAPAGVLAWTDREQEYAVLRALEGHGLPVPAVLALGLDERPFLVMERLPGAPPGRLTPAERRTLGLEVGRLLARLHALDPDELGLAATESPSEGTLAQVRQYQRLYESARPAPVPLLGALLAWAERNCPQDEVRPAVLWGDPGAHNLLVADGHVSALLDWELTHIGDPLDDLGAAVWSCLGSFDPDDIVTGYEEIAGAVDRQRLSYFVALASATRSVMVVNGTAAWIDGDVQLALERRPRARAPRARPGPRRAGRRVGRPTRLRWAASLLPAPPRSGRDRRRSQPLAPRRPGTGPRRPAPAADDEACRGLARHDGPADPAVAGRRPRGGRARGGRGGAGRR